VPACHPAPLATSIQASHNPLSPHPQEELQQCIEQMNIHEQHHIVCYPGPRGNRNQEELLEDSKVYIFKHGGRSARVYALTVQGRMAGIGFGEVGMYSPLHSFFPPSPLFPTLKDVCYHLAQLFGRGQEPPPRPADPQRQSLPQALRPRHLRPARPMATGAHRRATQEVGLILSFLPPSLPKLAEAWSSMN